MKPATKGFLFGALVLVILLVVAAYSLVSSIGDRPGHIVRINHKDPALESAIKEARAGLDGYIKELENPKPGEGFAIKASFKTLEGAEYLWVKSPTFTKDVFTGRLDQQPIAVAGKSKGDQVKVPKADVVDWLIKDDQGVRGMFTEKVLNK